jgi:hypothetical protein
MGGESWKGADEAERGYDVKEKTKESRFDGKTEREKERATSRREN